MAVLKTYPLDLSATLVSNKITGEVRTITKDADRVFIPTGGPFYTKTLKVWAGTTLLQPVKDYVALELNREGTLDSGKEVCNVLLIKHTATSFKIDYQVIGGIYSDYSNELADLINATPIDKLNILTWGSILGKPTVFPPTSHQHYPYEWRGYTQVIHLLEQLRQLIVASDQAELAAIYQYIENNIKNIAADYIDRNGLLFIDKNPTPNGNVLLDGLGTEAAPLKINLTELLKELDVRYFQNSINPLSRIGAISDNFLPISAGFFNSLVPLNRELSLSAVGNVERNGDLLMLTPATNGEITRYVYGYVRDWTNDPAITRYRPTNQQYRPPGLAADEEIMDLFGYHEQSMIGSIYTVTAGGTIAFKEHCVIWLNGTLSAESHVLERVGRELINALPNKTLQWIYGQSPKVVRLRRGEKFLLYFNDNSGVHVCRWDSTLKRFIQTGNWKAVLQKNTVDPVTDQKVHQITSTTETVIRTAQDFCRPFAWFEGEKIYPDEYTIFDVTNKAPNVVTHYTLDSGGLNRKRMGCRVVGDCIKVMTNVAYQSWIYDPAYRGGSVTSLGFSLEIYPLEAIPTYKWIRHSRANGVYGTGRNSCALTADDRGYMDIYETSAWTLIPMDVFSQWGWWENLQQRTHIQFNDGRLLVWGHPAPSGYPIYMLNPRYKPEGQYDVEKMFVLYHNTRQWYHPSLGNGDTFGIDENTINFPAPTVNRVNSAAIVLADGTIALANRRCDPRTLDWTNASYTAYRPAANQVGYRTGTNGVVLGLDTSNNRIALVGDVDGKYDLIPWVSARRADGSTKVGSLWWYKPMGTWVDQTVPASIRIDWAAKQFVREEMYTFTQQGYNAVQDYLTTKVAVSGATTLHLTWSVMASPIDPNTGLLFAYAGRDNRSAVELVVPVKLQWDGSRRLSGITISNTEARRIDHNVIPMEILDPRGSWSRLQWVIDYNADSSQAFWAGKLPGVTRVSGDLLPRPAINTFRESKSGANSTFTFMAAEGNQDNTSGYKTLVATPRGVGIMTDEVGYGVFRAFYPFKGLNYDSLTIYQSVAPYIYFTPRPPSDFSLNITDTIDVQLGGVYGQILPQKYLLTDPAVSDIVEPRNKTIFIYAILELGEPRINFREVAMAESIYATYIGKCVTDDYGVMEIDIQPVTRIGNYRPSATPRGSSFSVSSGTADTERLLNWDANIFSSETAEEIKKGNIPDIVLLNVAGTYQYLLGPGEAIQIEMVGGGGAGGNSAWSTEWVNDINGRRGGESILYIGGIQVLVAQGGGGGEGGTWANGSAFHNGNPGQGYGSYLQGYVDPIIHPSRIGLEIGRNGGYARWLSPGASAFKDIGNGARYGWGGNGSAPIVDGWAGGGGGASGSYVTCILRNTTDDLVPVAFTVGWGGAIAPQGSNKGAPGNGGAISIVHI